MSRALPVIDIGALSSLRFGDRLEVSLEIGSACRDRGFFYVVNHGIPEQLIARTLAESRKLFALPQAAKDAVHKSRSAANRGYESLGGQTLKPGGEPDLKEGFYIGPELAAGDPRIGRFNQGQNQWPDELPNFRTAMLEYHAALLALSKRLMDALALSLNLREAAFAEFCHEANALLRLLHYPPHPVESGNVMGAGEHTDFGALTILLQDVSGGLQVYDRGTGAWTAAEPLTRSFVVNLGDLIARWTNDRYRSTLHRVVNRSGTDRYSMPFFFSGAPEHRISCLPCCLAPGEMPKYKPVTAEEHIKERYRQTYGR